MTTVDERLEAAACEVRGLADNTPIPTYAPTQVSAATQQGSRLDSRCCGSVCRVGPGGWFRMAARR